MFFILFMCSCKSKEVVTKVDSTESLQSETSYMNEFTQVDTTMTVRVEQINDSKVITETIIIKEYDTNSGVVTKETKTERTVRQVIDKAVAEEEAKGITEVSKDSVNHFLEATKKMDEVKEIEFKGGFDWSSRWIGIVIGIGTSLLIFYILRKFLVN